MATWEDVRTIALGLPETEESTSYGKLAFKVRAKTFAWDSPHEAGALAVRVDPEERPLLLASSGAYWSTPHYDGESILLVHLDRIDSGELRERIVDSWLLRAPQTLAASFEG